MVFECSVQIASSMNLLVLLAFAQFTHLISSGCLKDHSENSLLHTLLVQFIKTFSLPNSGQFKSVSCCVCCFRLLLSVYLSCGLLIIYSPENWSWNVLWQRYREVACEVVSSCHCCLSSASRDQLWRTSVFALHLYLFSSLTLVNPCLSVS